jgi:Ca-activated chloride channel family protein
MTGAQSTDVTVTGAQSTDVTGMGAQSTDVTMGAQSTDVTGMGAQGTGTGTGMGVGVRAAGGLGGEVVLSLGGLCSGGAPVQGGLARLGDLDALPPMPSASAQTLYADTNMRVSASLAHDALPFRGGASSVVVELEGLAPPAVIAPLRVHLVIDASTSMEGAWQDVKQAALAVVRRLRPEDELQIVVYGTGAREVLAPVAIGDGRAARQVIRGMRFGGRTNIEAGLRLAYGASRPAGRSLVIVVSDGVPQGGLSGTDELGALAAEANASQGAVTLAIGLGTEFHTGILTAIGEGGGGELLLAPRSSELSLLLERALAARGAVIASDLDASVTALAGVALAGEGGLHAGALTAGDRRTFVVPIETTHTGTLAHIRIAFTLADGRPVELETSLSLGQARAPVVAGSIGAVIDLSLAEALRTAGQQIESGQGEAAAETLRAHVVTARASVPSPSAALASRNEAVLRIAGVLPSLVAEASWGARRAAGASFAARSFEILSGR